MAHCYSSPRKASSCLLYRLLSCIHSLPRVWLLFINYIASPQSRGKREDPLMSEHFLIPLHMVASLQWNCLNCDQDLGYSMWRTKGHRISGCHRSPIFRNIEVYGHTGWSQMGFIVSKFGNRGKRSRGWTEFLAQLLANKKHVPTVQNIGHWSWQCSLF